MNLHIGQPNRYVVLFGTLLSLWISWDWLFSAIQDLRLTTAILSPVALSPKERYKHYINLVNSCYRHHEYKSAAIYADKALENRVCLDVKDFEDIFASTLIGLGKYEEAKCLILKLAPLRKNGFAPLIAYRQDLMGQAYMGLHQYQFAAKEFEREVPGLIPENTMGPELEFRTFVAYACLGEKESARKVLIKLRRPRVMFGRLSYVDKSNNPVIAFYEPLMSMSANDVETAKRLCDDYIQFLQEPENLHDLETIAMLTDASRAMEDRGFSNEARRLMTCAERMKQEHKVN